MSTLAHRRTPGRKALDGARRDESPVSASTTSESTNRRPGLRRSASVPVFQRRFRLALGDERSVLSLAINDPSLALSTTERSKPYVAAKDLSPVDAIHTEIRPSLLSMDAPLKHQNFRGFYTLGGIVLFVMNARLVMENVLKYGIVIVPRPDVFYRAWYDRWPCTICAASFPLFVCLSYLIELGAQSAFVPAVLACTLHATLISLLCIVPIAVVHLSFADILPGITLLFLAAIFALKLISFAHVRHVARTSTTRLRDVHATDLNEKLTLHSPARFTHLWWFIAAPTLCYQEVYPRTKAIRSSFVARRICEIVFILTLEFVILHQYILPTIEHSFVHMDNRDIVRVVERLLKLAIPSTMLWLLGFYLFFHSTLNLTAELLRFGDRLFYMDWWNAPTLGAYWRTWNLPVRHFMLRHVYAPALRCGLSPITAQFIAFFLSAVVHELFFSVPCHMIQTWTFFGMLLQVPLVYITGRVYKRWKQPIWGNVAFWLVFCIFGQPLLMIMYGHSYVKMHHRQ
ncbi:diacylglycerol O-acyltransferase [Plasmodiophora brassicae]|uniref:diacylglycerol O-acyltransferase n=1 Tax=Plasmodiophora brassicae TaxID=37360 RepID=A0A0G4IZ62_PLABS|nr:hypothetical protein PBRA_001395 [Plasmodiophora brassicae]SPQ94149.1 unnamed protein product [Plasmodiophora brassicae]